MRQALFSIGWLLWQELRISWKQYSRGAGRIAGFSSPVLVLIVYLLLHVPFFLLKESSNVIFSPDKSSFGPGLALISLSLILFSFAVPMAVRMLWGRTDWLLLFTSPIPLGYIWSSRSILLAMRSLMLPLFLFSPGINVAILSGRWELISFYAGIFFVAVFVSSVSIALVHGCVSLIGMERAAFAGKAAGLLAVASLLSAQLLYGRSRTGAEMLAPLTGTDLFRAMNWIGRGLYGAVTPFFVIALCGTAGFGMAFFFTKRTGMAKLEGRKTGAGSSKSVTPASLSFSRDAMAGFFYKEWRLLARNREFFLQALRVIFVIGIVLMLVFKSLGAVDMRYVACAIVIASAVCMNDISWVMVNSEQQPELLMTSPLHYGTVRMYKVLSAMIPMLLVLAALVLCVGWFDFHWAAIVSVCGFMVIFSAALINFRVPFKDRKKSDAQVFLSQRVALVLLQGMNILFWAAIAYSC